MSLPEKAQKAASRTHKSSQSTVWDQLTHPSTSSTLQYIPKLLSTLRDSFDTSRRPGIANAIRNMGKWSKYGKRYNIDWEREKTMKDWIASVPGDTTKALCNFCNALVRAHRSDLIAHSNTKKHKRNSDTYSSRSLTSAVEGDNAWTTVRVSVLGKDVATMGLMSDNVEPKQAEGKHPPVLNVLHAL